jgi:hypothetical protein
LHKQFRAEAHFQNVSFCYKLVHCFELCSSLFLRLTDVVKYKITTYDFWSNSSVVNLCEPSFRKRPAFMRRIRQSFLALLMWSFKFSISSSVTPKNLMLLQCGICIPFNVIFTDEKFWFGLEKIIRFYLWRASVRRHFRVH